MAVARLNSLEDTRALGAWLAANLRGYGVTAVLTRGSLGAGKTAFLSALVAALPDAENAEISSPSFNIINYYPTTPPVAHCDLYRCERAYPDEIADALENPRVLTLVEWAEFLSPRDYPKNYLDIAFSLFQNIRSLLMTPHGSRAAELIAKLERESPLLLIHNR